MTKIVVGPDGAKELPLDAGDLAQRAIDDARFSAIALKTPKPSIEKIVEAILLGDAPTLAALKTAWTNWKAGN